MARDEIPKLRSLRDEYDRAREALMTGIKEQLELGEPNARIARSVDWSREYIARIRKERAAEKERAEEKDAGDDGS
ncbi:hypothetical protein [Streptomyces iconiensis]|uniref:Uncharacterized protein n=1 Tax=Streptomyces iconiensis TaxID=1384038 RepID=A0ABT6ZT31_9ACTN|nr:hypothetical protein [Streptomyces iconiensis]MDJ1131786.1 hypothetical protein [Streptomyces iconiensis]